jgi:hypothetical protein
MPQNTSALPDNSPSPRISVIQNSETRQQLSPDFQQQAALKNFYISLKSRCEKLDERDTSLLIKLTGCMLETQRLIDSSTGGRQLKRSERLSAFHIGGKQAFVTGAKNGIGISNPIIEEYCSPVEAFRRKDGSDKSSSHTPFFSYRDECYLVPFGSIEKDRDFLIDLNNAVQNRLFKDAVVCIRGRVDADFYQWLRGANAEDLGPASNIQLIYEFPLPSGEHYPITVKSVANKDSLRLLRPMITDDDDLAVVEGLYVDISRARMSGFRHW